MLKIYHNPNCSKSRQALEILESKNISFEIVLYAKVGWTQDTLKRLVKKCGGDIQSILRPANKFYKFYTLENATMQECIQIAMENPTVIERPLIETDTVAFLARPPEKINAIVYNVEYKQ